jgi:hypothetical protein
LNIKHYNPQAVIEGYEKMFKDHNTKHRFLAKTVAMQQRIIGMLTANFVLLETHNSRSGKSR